jgi:hypothetical protein
MVVAGADGQWCGEGRGPVLQQLRHGVNPSQGRKEKEAHHAWLHAAARVGGRELVVANWRRGGGKSLSSQRGVRHTGGSWGGVGRAGGGPERPGHEEWSRRSDGEEWSTTSGLLVEDGATACCQWQLNTALPHRLQQRWLATAVAGMEQRREKKMEGERNRGGGRIGLLL